MRIVHYLQYIVTEARSIHHKEFGQIFNASYLSHSIRISIACTKIYADCTHVEVLACA